MNDQTPGSFPKLTLEQIQAKVARQQFIQMEGSTLTICILELQNGYSVTGQSACVDPRNFDSEIGCKIAFENALEKIWELEGYLLKEQIWKESLQ